MKRNRIYTLISLLIALFFTIEAEAEENTTNSTRQVSILTCSPGQEIYELFGHTAIRYIDKERNADIVFNYGLFSFNSPNFIWRFIKGETDFMFGATDYSHFCFDYFSRNSYVYEQKLNLTDSEIDSLFTALLINYQPENKVYRYNFFYDNCTTRAKEKIEEAIDGGVVYNKEMPEMSFRDIIHQFTEGHEWSELGIDICLGSEADRPITQKEMMFAPFYYKDMLSHANKIKTGEPLAQAAEAVVVPMGENEPSHTPSPMLCFAIFFVVIALLTFIEYRKKKTYWGIDAILFGGTGIAGAIIAFLVFISTHPAVSPNYLLFFMHPLHLILLPWIIYGEIKHKKPYYHIANFTVILIFFAAYFIIPQKFNGAILFLALSLLIRSLSQIIKFKKYKR